VGLVEAVERDVAELDDAGRASGVAALALALAHQMDVRPGAMVAKELRETLAVLAEMPRAVKETSHLGELAARRRARRA
jgi:hypothetical protein